MAVDSRISSKTYKTNIDELEPNDQNLKSELYEVSIFNHPLKIAPGLVIQEDNLSYCYVYAIKNNKVVKKIGVYEKIDDSSDLFDLTTFSEGSLCLFDVYEKNPSLILELEDTDKDTETNLKEDVFDFILTKINDDEPDKKVEITKKSYKEILLLLTAKKKEDTENNKIITNLLNLIKKTIGDKKYYGEATQDKIKTYATDFKKRILSLIVTEPFLGLRFIFTKDGDPIDDSEFREWSIKSEIKEYVIVSENFDVIETYPADSLDSKYTLPESDVETEFKSEADESKVESKVKNKSARSSKGAPRGTSLNAASLPRGTSLNAKIVKEPKQETLSAIMEVNEPDSKTESSKTESKIKNKSRSKAESKAESKSDSKADGQEVDLNAGIDYSEPELETKAESKPKSKAKSLSKSETKSEGYNLDLNSVDESVTSESKKSKIKAPGASIRPKSSQKK